MVPKELVKLIEKYCMGLQPTDAQQDEIFDKVAELNADIQEVADLMEKLQNGPTLEEIKAKEAAERKAKEEAERKKAEAVAKRKATLEKKKAAEQKAKQERERLELEEQKKKEQANRMAAAAIENAKLEKKKNRRFWTKTVSIICIGVPCIYAIVGYFWPTVAQVISALGLLFLPIAIIRLLVESECRKAKIIIPLVLLWMILLLLSIIETRWR